MIENYFEKIDTKEKAYWLGFLIGDGYITKSSKTLQLCLGLKDEHLIDRFLFDIEETHIVKKYYGPYKTAGKSVQIRVTNEKFVNFLIQSGCYNRKSLTARFPKIDDMSFSLSILLGLYDADGSQNTTDITSGSKLLLEDIKKIFSINNKIRIEKNVFILSLGVPLFRKMIENFSGYLSRKRGLYHLGKVNLLTTKRIKNKRFFSTKIMWPSVEEMLTLVWVYPSSILSKKLGASDTAIKNFCRKNGIEKPPRGYWAKHFFLNSRPYQRIDGRD